MSGGGGGEQRRGGEGKRAARLRGAALGPESLIPDHISAFYFTSDATYRTPLFWPHENVSLLRQYTRLPIAYKEWQSNVNE